MKINYPKETIWYVESRSQNDLNSKAEAKGSAVCIWLRKKNDPNDGGKRFLLTCAHVIRDKHYGAPLPCIYVWKPGDGFSPANAKIAKLTKIRELSSSSVPKADQNVAEIDWVVLEVDDGSFSNAAKSIQDWPSDQEKDLTIVGYPGGDGVFHRQIVSPDDSREFRIVDRVDGAIIVKGPEETRPGMSGGGVFDAEGNFAGLHRSSMERLDQYKSISAFHIKEAIEAKNYELIPRAIPRVREVPWRWLAAAICMLVLIGGGLYYSRPEPIGDVIQRLGGGYQSVAMEPTDADEPREDSQRLFQITWEPHGEEFERIVNDLERVSEEGYVFEVEFAKDQSDFVNKALEQLAADEVAIASLTADENSITENGAKAIRKLSGRLHSISLRDCELDKTKLGLLFADIDGNSDDYAELNRLDIRENPDVQLVSVLKSAKLDTILRKLLKNRTRANLANDQDSLESDFRLTQHPLLAPGKWPGIEVAAGSRWLVEGDEIASDDQLFEVRTVDFEVSNNSAENVNGIVPALKYVSTVSIKTTGEVANEQLTQEPEVSAIALLPKRPAKLKSLSLEFASTGDRFFSVDSWFLQNYRLSLESLEIRETDASEFDDIVNLLGDSSNVTISSVSTQSNTDFSKLIGVERLEIKMDATKQAGSFSALPLATGLPALVEYGGLKELKIDGFNLTTADIDALINSDLAVEFGPRIGVEQSLENIGKILELDQEFTIPKGILSVESFAELMDQTLDTSNEAGLQKAKDFLERVAQLDETKVDDRRLIEVTNLMLTPAAMEALCDQYITRFETSSQNLLLDKGQNLDLELVKWSDLEFFRINNVRATAADFEFLKQSSKLRQLSLMDLPDIGVDILSLVAVLNEGADESHRRKLKLAMGGIYGLPRQCETGTPLQRAIIQELRLGHPAKDKLTVVLAQEWNSFCETVTQQIAKIDNRETEQWIEQYGKRSNVLVIENGDQEFTKMDLLSINRACFACLTACGDDPEKSQEFDETCWNSHYRERATRLLEYLPQEPLEDGQTDAEIINLWLPAFIETRSRIEFRKGNPELAKSLLEQAIELLESNQATAIEVDRNLARKYPVWGKKWPAALAKYD